MRASFAKRLWSRVDRRGPDECWPWTGARNDRGYGQIRLDGRPQYAHRVVHELLVGPIPEGRQIDHLCRVRACVNPAHMETVTSAENTRRGEPATRPTCPQGHAYDEANTYRNGGHRYCRACHRAAVSRAKRVRREARSVAAA